MGKNNTIDKKVVTLSRNQDVSISKIKKIRDLIFGDDIEQYNSEFEALKIDIRSKKKVLEDLIEEVRIDLKTAIDNVAVDANLRISELETKIDKRVENLEVNKVDKKKLGKMLIELGEKVSQK